MKSYTITIAPDDDAGATAVIQVVVNGSSPLLKRFSLIASEGEMLSTSQLSQFNSERLVSAVLPAATLMPLGNESPRAELVEAQPPASVGPGVREAPAVEPPQPATMVTSPGRTKVNVAPDRSAPALTPPEPTEPQASEPRGSRAAGPDKLDATRGVERGQRTYRVMPADFLSRYGTSTMAELADAYGVPLYTIQSWIGTARKQGKLPPARKRRPRLREGTVRPPAA